MSLSCSASDIKKPIPVGDNESVRIQLEDSFKKGGEGIKEILKILEKSLQNPYNATDYSTANLSINYIYKLVSSGMKYDKKEVAETLIMAINKQIYMTDTLTTAKTLQIVTGVDVGYNKEFVETYTENEEPKRQGMILKWKESIEKNGAAHIQLFKQQR